MGQRSFQRLRLGIRLAFSRQPRRDAKVDELSFVQLRMNDDILRLEVTFTFPVEKLNSQDCCGQLSDKIDFALAPVLLCLRYRLKGLYLMRYTTTHIVAQRPH